MSLLTLFLSAVSKKLETDIRFLGMARKVHAVVGSKVESIATAPKRVYSANPSKSHAQVVTARIYTVKP